MSSLRQRIKRANQPAWMGKRPSKKVVRLLEEIDRESRSEEEHKQLVRRGLKPPLGEVFCGE